MRNIIFLGAAAALALIATDPAFCMQAAPPPPADPTQPIEPAPPSEPMPALQPPIQGSTDVPVGPMATPPTQAAPVAQSGGTTTAMMQPVAATKEYPLCSKTVQDSCRNPGEGPKVTRKRR